MNTSNETKYRIATALKERDLHRHSTVNGVKHMMEVTYGKDHPESQQEPKATDEMRILFKRE